MYKEILFFLVSSMLGCLIGLLGCALQIMIAHVEKFFLWLNHFSSYPWLLNMSITMLMVYLAQLLVIRIAPEASGSGIQEIQAYLIHKKKIFWKRLIPVKFFGGIMVLSSKMLLGREGPTIQLGGNLGFMLAEKFKLSQESKDCLVAAGAGAGLATAFNAPLAGILFVTEQMRTSFKFSVFRFKQILVCVIASTIMNDYILGVKPQIALPQVVIPGVSSVLVFFLVGVIIGLFGLVYNSWTMSILFWKDSLKPQYQKYFVLLVAAVIGLLSTYFPICVGEGFGLIDNTVGQVMPVKILFSIFLTRFVLGMMCYATVTPGGLFSPMLALGTLLGLMLYYLFYGLNSYLALSPETFAAVGMAALFTATVQAPLTGIILVIELTRNYDFILPLMVACSSAALVTQLETNPSIYKSLLSRTLNQQKN